MRDFFDSYKNYNTNVLKLFINTLNNFLKNLLFLFGWNIARHG